MAEYIEREALLEDIQAAVDNGGMGGIVAGALKRYVKRVPAADVAPVRQELWVLIGADKRGRGGIWKCTACNKSYPHKCDFCPNCGAEMDLEVDDGRIRDEAEN